MNEVDSNSRLVHDVTKPLILSHPTPSLQTTEATRVHGEVLTTAFHNQKMMTMIQSVGPAALITPWNFPSAMITRKLGPALAAGCTVVLKPSEETVRNYHQMNA